MPTTGWTFKGKFYAYGSELPQELKDVLKARGLDEMGNPLKPEPPAPPPIVEVEVKPAEIITPRRGRGKAK